MLVLILIVASLGIMISFNVLFFWVSILFVFWLASLGTKKEAMVATVLVPAMTQPSVLRP